MAYTASLLPNWQLSFDMDYSPQYDATRIHTLIWLSAARKDILLAFSHQIFQQRLDPD